MAKPPRVWTGPERISALRRPTGQRAAWRRHGRFKRKVSGVRSTIPDRPQESHHGCLRCRITAGNRLRLLPACASRASHALAQRYRADDSADERAPDLQRPSGVVLGQVVVHGRTAASGHARGANERPRDRRAHPRARSRIRHHGTVRRVEEPQRAMDPARIPVVGDHSGQPVAVDGAVLAFLLRLGVRARTVSRTSSIRLAAGILRATSRPPATTGAGSAGR